MAILSLLVLAAVTLVGVIWIVVFRSVFTVDGLFMSLILLTMSGIVGTTALFELKHRMSGTAIAGARGGTVHAGQIQFPGEIVHRGKVEDVVFYEANVGQPNKSVVTLADGNAPQTLVVEGDLRNALPIGQRVRIILRKEDGENVLVNLSYS